MTLDELKDKYQMYRDSEAMAAGRCATEELRKHYLPALTFVGAELAVCAMCIDHDFQRARRLFSNASIALEFAWISYQQPVFYSPRNFCYAVLSDDSRVIERYTELQPVQTGLGLATGVAQAIRAVIKNEPAALESAIALIAKQTKKKTWEKHFAGAVNAFTGLLQKDKELVQKGIQELLAAHKRQQQPAVLKDFFNPESAALAKLALRLGMELDIQSPLLPKAIVPLEECPSYPGYEFFREIGY